MGWRDRLADPNIQTYAFATVEGCPYVLDSQTLPSGWIASPYEEITCLDLSKGLEVPQSPLERKAGVASPASVSLRLGPRQAPRLAEILAPRGAALRTKLTADFLYDEAATLYCDTAGWPASGVACIGLEAVAYASKDGAGTHFHLEAAPNGRARFDSVERQYRIADGTRWITSQPEGMEGRHLRLWLGLADMNGTPLDAAMYGDNQWEVFRGTIQSVIVNEDWHTWTLGLTGLEEDLGVEIGGEKRCGYLHASGTLAEQSNTAMGAFVTGWINPGASHVYLTATDSGATTDVEFDIDLLAAAPYTPLYSGNLAQTITDAIMAALNADATLTSNWIAGWDTNALSGYDSNDDAKWLDARQQIYIGSDDTTAAVRLRTGPGDVLPQLGYAPADLDGEDYNYVGLTGSWFRASNFPLALYVPPDATAFTAIWEPAEDPPSSGYLAVGGDDALELAHYSSWGTVKSTVPKTLVFALDKRGACGTVPVTIAIPWASVANVAKIPHQVSKFSFDWGTLSWKKKTTTVYHDRDVASVSLSEQVEVRLVAALPSVNILTAIRNVCMSTGTAGTRGTFDVDAIHEGFGGALDPDLFDLAGIAHLGGLLPVLYRTRDIAITKTVTLRDWIAQELLALGLTMQARTLPDDTYRLTIDRLTDPLLIGLDTLTAADLDVETGIKVTRHLDNIVNVLSAQAIYSPATDDFAETKWTYRDINSIADYGKRPAMEIKPRGLTAQIGGVQSVLTQMVGGILSHWSRPYEIVVMGTKRWAWAYQPGQQITLTLAGLPASTGGYGWTAEPLVVLAVQPTYIGQGMKPAATLTAIHMGDRRLTYYAPTGLVSSIAPGGLVLTLAANEFSTAGVPYPLDPTVTCKDVRWFDGLGAGAQVFIANEGDEASGITRTIDSVDVAASTVTVTVSTGAFVAGSRCVITFASYDSCTETQKQWAFLADAAATLGAAGDAAMQFSG